MAHEHLRPHLQVVRNGPGQAYLVRTAAGVILIDTGPPGTGAEVTAALAEWGLGPDALRAVLITHWHADHTGSAAEIAAWPGVEVWAQRQEAPVIRGEEPGADPVLTPAEEPMYRQIAELGLTAPPTRVDREIADDQDEITDLGVRVLACPGHTDGSVAYHVPDLEILLTGDIAAQVDGALTLGAFHVDRARARDSFRGFGDLEDLDVVGFGHGPPLLGADTDRLATAARRTEIPDLFGPDPR